jgi:hypothetical protein
MLVVMAEHRRVEPRGIIVGTGMLSDVDRIRDVEADKERKERAWRNAPARGFGEVLETAPAKAELEEEEHDDPRKKKPPPELPANAPAPVDMANAALGNAASEAAPSEAASSKAASTSSSNVRGRKDLPKVPRDPRERLLREQLAKNQAQPKGTTSNDTPPTGSHARKPAR